VYGFFDVNPEMYEVAKSIAHNATLAKAIGDAILDYQPVVIPGGVGVVAGPTFLDNAEYRKYVFDTFQAVSVDMETPAPAHVATQFGKKLLFIQSLSNLARGEDKGNTIGVFFGVAAANAVMTLTAFLEALPIQNNSGDSLRTPNNRLPTITHLVRILQVSWVS
jgi:adenosylhomocysteine nucleosidase